MSFTSERPSRVDLLPYVGLVLFLKSVPHIVLLVSPRVTGKRLLSAYQAKLSENAIDWIVVCVYVVTYFFYCFSVMCLFDIRRNTN